MNVADRTIQDAQNYERCLARVQTLAAFDPAKDSRDGIELDHLATAIDLYERAFQGIQRRIGACQHDFGPNPDPDGQFCLKGCGGLFQA